MSFRSLLLFFIVMAPLSASAQGYLQSLQYRPLGLNWQQLHTEHFRIIYPKSEELSAYRSARILEQQYPKASELTGGSLQNFPVILNSYNDLSNGYVTTFNFRSEVDLAPQKGKSMNPQTGSWLETVLSHELLHATHFNVQQPVDEKVPSLANLLSFMGPDIGRSIHGFAPTGVHEGLAVYHESNAITPNGGRGNYPVFTNRFNANFNSVKRWNMAQQLFPTDYTLPYNRHYLAGYTFTDWLHQEFGDDISRKTIRFHYHHFFLGYGYALRKKTGLWPGQLYALYTKQMEQEEEKRLNDLQNPNTDFARHISLPFKGRQVHAPKWLNDHTLLLYGSSYNSRIGFYTYNLETEDLELLQETFAAGNFHHQLMADSSLIYAGYRAHSTIPGTYRSDIRQLDLSTNSTSSLTKNKRVHTPTSSIEKLLAIQTKGATEQIVEILPNGETDVLKSFRNATPIQLAFNPKNNDELAVVSNRRGVQALWLVSPDSLDKDLDKAPGLAFKNGSIHDVSWHPEGHKLLFTLDAPPAANIYEFHPQKRTLTQLTNAPFNAFEASYSPDGSRIAFILQDGDEQVSAVLEQSHFLNRAVADTALLTGTELREQLQQPWLGAGSSDSLQSIESGPYRSGIGWLKPRLFYPVATEKANTLQTGFGFSSIDALSSQAYSAEVTGIQNRLWYDVSYANKMFFPGFQINMYSDPDFMVLGNNPNNQQFSVMRQDRGLSLSIPAEFILRGDTRLTSITINPEIAAEQFRYFDLSPEPLSDFTTRYKGGLYSHFNLGVLTRRRDLQPTSGLSMFGMYERSLNETDYSIDVRDVTFQYQLEDQWTAYYGIFGFLSPLRRFNQSLRIDLQFFQQSTPPFYSNSTIVPMGFKENPFPTYGDNGHQFQHLGRLSTRYTIPLWYPDNGFLTVPFYASSLYLTTFTHTLTDMNSKDLAGSIRTIVGGGLHLQFKISNLLLDFGLGLAIEPSRNNTQLIFGQF